MRAGRSSLFCHAGPRLAVVAVLSCAACVGTRPTLSPSLPEAFPNHSADEILDRLSAGLDTLRSYSAESSVAVAGPGGTAHFSAHSRQRRGDSIRVDIRVQLGIEAARILVTNDSIYVYDRIKNTVYHGDIRSANHLFSAPWHSAELFMDMLGLRELPRDTEWMVQHDSTRYFLADGDDGKTVFIDPALWRIIRYEERTPSGTLIEERTFLDFDGFDGVPLPRRIVVRRPIDRVSATIQHRRLNLNPSEIDLKFDVKDDAKYIRI